MPWELPVSIHFTPHACCYYPLPFVKRPQAVHDEILFRWQVGVQCLWGLLPRLFVLGHSISLAFQDTWAVCSQSSGTVLHGVALGFFSHCLLVWSASHPWIPWPVIQSWHVSVRLNFIAHATIPLLSWLPEILQTAFLSTDPSVCLETDNCWICSLPMGGVVHNEKLKHMGVVVEREGCEGG